jgi:hypothetical protein
MTEKDERKIKVEDLPEAEQELTAEEAKEVKGGLNFTKIEYKTINSPATRDQS